MTASFTTVTRSAGLNCVSSTVSGCDVFDCSGDLNGGSTVDDSGASISVVIGSQTLTAPALRAIGSGLTVPSTSDFTLSFTGGAGGRLSAQLRIASTSRSQLATCSADASTNSLVFPGALLASLAKGQGTLTAWTASTSAPFLYLGHSTTTSAMTEVLVPGGDGFGVAQITLQ